ncbi:MAG: DUF4340 domain-containing protein [Phycisphaerales bacterium]
MLRKPWWFVIAALAIVGVAVIAQRARTPAAPAEGAPRQGPFLPSVRDKADAIDRIEVQRGSRTMRLVRTNGQWIAPDKADMPVEPERVRDLLRGVANLEVEQAMTSSRERHADLDLEWSSPAGGGATGAGAGASGEAPRGAAGATSRATLLRLFAEGEQAPLAEIVVGKTRFSPKAVYVRRLGEDQTWRCAGEVPVDIDAVRLMNPVLVELPAESLDAINWSGASGGPSAIVRRDAGGGWVVEGDVAAERRSEAARVLPELFARLEFDDVRRAPASPDAPLATITGAIGDRTIAIELLPDATPGADASAAAPKATSGAGHWYRVVVGPTAPGVGTAAPSAEIVAKLEAIAARTAGREFRLPTWRSTRLDGLMAAPSPNDATPAPVGEGESGPSGNDVVDEP